MPGPVRYTKSGKVKKATPRKYESGKGWSKMAESPAPAPTRSKVRKSEVRKTLSRGDFGRRFSRSTPVKRVDTRDLDTRESNREALGPVGDALATVARAIQEPVDLPGTKLDKLGEMLSFLAPGGVVKGATVKGVEGLRHRKIAEAITGRGRGGKKIAEGARKRAERLNREAMDKVRRERFLNRRRTKKARREAKADFYNATRTKRRRNRRNRTLAEKRRAREAAMERNEMRGWQRDEWNEAGPGQ
jgi:hypothetical protein